MRGEVKYKARNLVAILYGIEDLKGKPDGKTLIRRLVESLLDRQAFVYEVIVISICLSHICLFFVGRGESHGILHAQGDPVRCQRSLVPRSQRGRSPTSRRLLLAYDGTLALPACPRMHGGKHSLFVTHIC